jgi:uncharacterized protein YjbI with pentapeptide repeats
MSKNLANTLKQNLRKLTQNPYFKIYLVVLIVLAILVFWVSHWGIQVSSNYANLQPKEKFNPSLEITKAIISGAGTVSTIIGGVFLYLNYVEARRKNSTDAKLAESRLITERFSKAIEYLGNEKLHVRLGGIYSLERISQDSDRDYWTVIEVLSTFIRTNSPLLENLSTTPDLQTEITEKETVTLNIPINPDIQAALIIIARRDESNDQEKEVDLRKIDLCQSELTKAKLNKVNFSGSKLFHINLSGGELIHAKFCGSRITLINFSKADLTNADFKFTKLSQSNFENAVLKKADFRHAIFLNGNALKNADLRDCNFSGAQLIGTDLRGSDLSNADLSNAELSGSNFEGADLSNTNLENARGFNKDLHKGLRFCNTTMPDGTINNSSCDTKT